jgi:phosphatidylserine/phosphatidylglycerophosphate/cardiolipin synthase-like enzyme
MVCKFAAELHEKGILTSHLLVSGSMNLTYNGLRRLEESILLTDDSDTVARARHAYEDRWGLP